jgi:hypothetical protein
MFCAMFGLLFKAPSATMIALPNLILPVLFSGAGRSLAAPPSCFVDFLAFFRHIAAFAVDS